MENWLNNLWSSSTSPAYLFLSLFLSCKISCQTAPKFHLFSALHTCLLSIQSLISIIASLTYLFVFSVSLAQLLGYFHLSPATSLPSYCTLSPPTSELTEISVCHVCQQTFCTNFNSRTFPNYSSAPCTTRKLCFCNNLLLAKLHPHPSLPASLF